MNVVAAKARRAKRKIDERRGPLSLDVIETIGRVVDLYEPECLSDEEAYHKASSLVGNASVDIWQGDRWIACLDGRDPQRIDLMHHAVAR